MAETIIEGISEVEGIEAVLNELKEVDLNNIADYDAILVGSPNHFGGPTRSVKKFVDKLGKLHLKGKLVAAFDTYIGRDFEKAVKKMEKRINEKVPGLKMIAPGLSIKIRGIKGPISEGDFLNAKSSETK